MRNRAERRADRLEHVQALLRMYNEPPLNRFVDNPQIAELITYLEREEQRLRCPVAACDCRDSLATNR